MVVTETRKIRIAAALIDDDQGRLLLVRKSGTIWFMQAGGKIEPGESAILALARELQEELGISLNPDHARHLGCCSAPAANEPGHLVEAELFHVPLAHRPLPSAEIEEVVWVAPSQAWQMALAPLTRDHVLPLALRLMSTRCQQGRG